MINSIQYFNEISTKNLENLRNDFFQNPKDVATFIKNSREEFINVLLRFIGETFTEIDQFIRDSGKRKENWHIVTRDAKSLITSVGEIHFEKTLFINKETGENEYLLDRLIGMKPKERMTEDAHENLLKEAVQSSYRRAGDELSLTSSVSKQTVKNKLHELKFPPPKKPVKKKVVDYLYIDADEDHVPLQFREKKGDLVKGENGHKYNTVLAKLVYVYEGVEKEAPKSKRHRLINPHYFSGVYSGEANAGLWDEVYEYIDSHYDLSKVKKIYLNSDGGKWITVAASRFKGITKVLDGFHLSKYLVKMTGHFVNEADRWNSLYDLKEAIRDGNKEDFIYVTEKVRYFAGSESDRKRIDESRDYILNNWMPAKARLHSRDKIMGCSAEGHVSHVLSSRMSSRPMGWSILGVDKMARLRAYYWNKGDMLFLVRYQNVELKKAAGCEEIIYSAGEMLASETNGHVNRELGKYFEAMRATATKNINKYVGLTACLWDII